MDAGAMARDAAKGGGERKQSRAERLAAELRANLARRKTQARARRDGEADQRPEGLQAPAPDREPGEDA